MLMMDHGLATFMTHTVNNYGNAKVTMKEPTALVKNTGLPTVMKALVCQELNMAKNSDAWALI